MIVLPLFTPFRYDNIREPCMAPEPPSLSIFVFTI